MLRLPWAFVFLFLNPEATGSQPPEEAAADNEKLRHLAQGYLANREAFPFLSCEMQKREGVVTSLEAAIRGDLKEAISWDIAWLVDGSRVKHVMKCDAQSIVQAQKRKKKSEINPGFELDLCGAESVLFDGNLLFRHAPNIAGANIMRPQGSRPGIMWTPFGMGIMGPDDESNPGALLRQCLAGKYYASYEGTEVIDGVTVSKVGIGRTREELALYYWMDVDRGCLPIRIESRVPKSGLVRYLAIVKDVRKCSNNRWFPVRSVVVDEPYRKEAALRAREFHVKSLEVDTPPKKQGFELTVPAGTQISEPDKGNAFFTLKQEERIRVSDLEQLRARCVLDLQSRPPGGGPS